MNIGRNVVINEVKMDGMKIKEYPQFQDDDEIGLLAVEQNGLAIEHLSERV